MQRELDEGKRPETTRPLTAAADGALDVVDENKLPMAVMYLTQVQARKERLILQRCSTSWLMGWSQNKHLRVDLGSKASPT